MVRESGNLSVIPDTNVILAASVNTYLEETGVSVSHRFYDHASALFSQIAAHPGIGVLTSRIQLEADEKLQKAFEDTVEEQTGRRFWKSASFALNRCSDSMDYFLSLLNSVIVTEDGMWKKIKEEVRAMYIGLRGIIADEEYETYPSRVKSVPKRLRPLAKGIYRGQISKYAKTGNKVRQQHQISDQDERILTDSVWISRTSKTKLRVILSSCDTMLVSSRGNLTIPQRIQSTFGIESHWPGVAAGHIAKHFSTSQ